MSWEQRGDDFGEPHPQPWTVWENPLPPRSHAQLPPGTCVGKYVLLYYKVLRWVSAAGSSLVAVGCVVKRRHLGRVVDERHFDASELSSSGAHLGRRNVSEVRGAKLGSVFGCEPYPPSHDLCSGYGNGGMERFGLLTKRR